MTLKSLKKATRNTSGFRYHFSCMFQLITYPRTLDFDDPIMVFEGFSISDQNRSWLKNPQKMLQNQPQIHENTVKNTTKKTVYFYIGSGMPNGPRNRRKRGSHQNRYFVSEAPQNTRIYGIFAYPWSNYSRKHVFLTYLDPLGPSKRPKSHLDHNLIVKWSPRGPKTRENTVFSQPNQQKPRENTYFRMKQASWALLCLGSRPLARNAQNKPPGAILARFWASGQQCSK